MNEMAVIVPTRGRPQNVRRIMEAWALTRAEATLWLGVDTDDETFDAAMVNAWIDEFGVDVRATSLKRTYMNGTLNAIAIEAAAEYEFLGFMGDDHCPRTNRWDRIVVEELDRLGTGIVYGNDLLQRATLPTAVFMTSDIVKALGYFSPPDLHHLYCDNSWRDWGQGIKRYSYLPDVIVEHMHYQIGKAEEDEGYTRVNSPEMYEHDMEAYRIYCAKQESLDLATLRALL
jgi:hypothetical protein